MPFGKDTDIVIYNQAQLDELSTKNTEDFNHEVSSSDTLVTVQDLIRINYLGDEFITHPEKVTSTQEEEKEEAEVVTKTQEEVAEIVKKFLGDDSEFAEKFMRTGGQTFLYHTILPLVNDCSCQGVNLTAYDKHLIIGLYSKVSKNKVRFFALQLNYTFMKDPNKYQAHQLNNDLSPKLTPIPTTNHMPLQEKLKKIGELLPEVSRKHRSELQAILREHMQPDNTDLLTAYRLIESKLAKFLPKACSEFGLTECPIRPIASTGMILEITNNGEKPAKVEVIDFAVIKNTKDVQFSSKFLTTHINTLSDDELTQNLGELFAKPPNEEKKSKRQHHRDAYADYLTDFRKGRRISFFYTFFSNISSFKEYANDTTKDIEAIVDRARTSFTNLKNTLAPTAEKKKIYDHYKMSLEQQRSNISFHLRQLTTTKKDLIYYMTMCGGRLNRSQLEKFYESLSPKELQLLYKLKRRASIEEDSNTEHTSSHTSSAEENLNSKDKIQELVDAHVKANKLALKYLPQLPLLDEAIGQLTQLKAHLTEVRAEINQLANTTDATSNETNANNLQGWSTLFASPTPIPTMVGFEQIRFEAFYGRSTMEVLKEQGCIYNKEFGVLQPFDPEDDATLTHALQQQKPIHLVPYGDPRNYQGSLKSNGTDEITASFFDPSIAHYHSRAEYHNALASWLRWSLPSAMQDTDHSAHGTPKIYSRCGHGKDAEYVYRVTLTVATAVYGKENVVRDKQRPDLKPIANLLLKSVYKKLIDELKANHVAKEQQLSKLLDKEENNFILTQKRSSPFQL